jgi:hypothetical protein
MWTHNRRRAAILQFLRVQFRYQTVFQAPYEPEACRGVLAMREPRPIHSPAQSSVALAAPRFFHPISIGYLPRPTFPSRSRRTLERPHPKTPDPPQRNDSHPAFDRSLANLVDPSRLLSQNDLPCDQAQAGSTQVRLGPVFGNSSITTFFVFQARAKLPAAAARTLVASMSASILPGN